jgi:hypothetical protein
MLHNLLTTPSWLGSNFLLMHALVNHSQDKDQFLKVAVKRMTETQVLPDELKEVSKLNSVLLAQRLELETKLAKES